MRLIYTRIEAIEAFRPVVEANEEIQESVSDGLGAILPTDFLKKLSDLDHAVRNYMVDDHA